MASAAVCAHGRAVVGALCGRGPVVPAAVRHLARAKKVLDRPKRCRLAHAFLGTAAARNGCCWPSFNSGPTRRLSHFGGCRRRGAWRRRAAVHVDGNRNRHPARVLVRGLEGARLASRGRCKVILTTQPCIFCVEKHQWNIRGGVRMTLKSTPKLAVQLHVPPWGPCIAVQNPH